MAKRIVIKCFMRILEIKKNPQKYYLTKGKADLLEIIIDIQSEIEKFNTSFLHESYYEFFHY